MMRPTVLSVVAMICSLAWSQAVAPRAGQGPPTAKEAPLAADELAADSMVHSAVDLIYSPLGTPALVGRRVALLLHAYELAPRDPRVLRLLANVVYPHDLNDRKAAIRAARAYLVLCPTDYKQAMNWWLLQLEELNTADDRMALAKSVLAAEGLAAAIRAEAAAELSARLSGQGRQVDSKEALAQARKLDPYCVSALDATLRSSLPVQRLEAMLGRLRTNPRDWITVGNAGMLLGLAGMYAEALLFLEHAWQRGSGTPAGRDLARWYASGLLDAGQVDEAVKFLEGPAARYEDDLYLHALQAEACRAAGQDKKAEQTVKAMADLCLKREGLAKSRAEIARELGWFYVHFGRNAKLGLAYAKEAAAFRPEDSVARRVLGIAELETGQTEVGKKRLAELASMDAYAAAYLAEARFESGDVEGGKQALLAGAATSRDGSAFRRLRNVAKAAGVTLPPGEDKAAAEVTLRSFDMRYLQMSIQPAEFIQVRLLPVRPSVVPGEPIEVQAVLTNAGPLPIAVGREGFFEPTVALVVTLAEHKKRFTDLPPAVWPAPRYLGPGNSIRTTLRLDVGDLGDALASDPFGRHTLIVDGLLSPAQQGDQIVGLLPGLRVAPARIFRRDILVSFDRTSGEAWPKAYQLTLGYIVRDLKRGDLPQRMRAARQIGCLLALEKLVDENRAAPPQPLAKAFTRPVLLSMLNAMLQDASPVVRAEMVASLGRARLDKFVLKILSKALADSSPLVLSRMAELLGASGGQAGRAAIDYLARHKDPNVRRMAEAFRKEPA